MRGHTQFRNEERCPLGRLNSKVAIVIGAARGIGEAIARAFIAERAFVYVTDIDDARRALAEHLGKMARFEALDVREEEDRRHVMAAILFQQGCLDVLVNNAGITGLEAGQVAHDPEHATLEYAGQEWRSCCLHSCNALRPLNPS